MLNETILQFGIPGGPEVLVILLIAVLLFGANKIPKLARSTGEAMGEFQKGREEVEQELEEMRQSGNSSTGGRDVEETQNTEPSGNTTSADGQESAASPETDMGME